MTVSYIEIEYMYTYFCIWVFTQTYVMQINVNVMLTRGQNAVDELLVSDSSILVSIDATKNIQYPGFEVTYPLHVSFPPEVEVKISKLLQLHVPKRRFLDSHMDSNTNGLFYQSYSAVMITSFSLCRCSSSLLCLPWARSQSFLHWFTSWHIMGVWGSSISRGRGTDGGAFAVPLLSMHQYNPQRLQPNACTQ